MIYFNILESIIMSNWKKHIFLSCDLIYILALKTRPTSFQQNNICIIDYLFLRFKNILKNLRFFFLQNLYIFILVLKINFKKIKKIIILIY